MFLLRLYLTIYANKQKSKPLYCTKQTITWKQEWKKNATQQKKNTTKAKTSKQKKLWGWISNAIWANDNKIKCIAYVYSV